MTSESPSSRKVRLTPPCSSSGSVPFQLISKRLPRWFLSGPEMVPLPKRSPPFLAQRHIFPLLDVARAPVIQDHEAKNHRFGLALGQHLADRRGLPDHHAHFEFEIEPLAGPKARHIRARRF